MSLLPYVFDDISPFNRTGLDFLFNKCPYLHSLNGYIRENVPELVGIEQEANIGKDGFQVCLDVQHFKPNEISVKTENNTVVVHAKHEEKEDSHGYISREFTRRYELPDGFKADDIISSLSSDGILSIKAPHANAIESNTRHIQIQQTGPARLNITKNEEKKDEKEKSK